jgi:hypothetical protein
MGINPNAISHNMTGSGTLTGLVGLEPDKVVSIVNDSPAIVLKPLNLNSSS